MATDEETERRFCFHLISPQRSFFLQVLILILILLFVSNFFFKAENERHFKIWTTVLMNAISKALDLQLSPQGFFFFFFFQLSIPFSKNRTITNNHFTHPSLNNQNQQKKEKRNKSTIFNFKESMTSTLPMAVVLIVMLLILHGCLLIWV